MELAKARYSVRKFSDKPIEKEKMGLSLNFRTEYLALARSMNVICMHTFPV